MQLQSQLPLPPPPQKLRTLDRYTIKRKKRRLKTLKNNNIQKSNYPFTLPPPQQPPHSGDIPDEVIYSEILTRLPVQSLIRFKSVAKPWKSLINTPHFVKTYLKQTLLNSYVPFNCVFIRSPYHFYILNFGAYYVYSDENRVEKGLIPVKNVSYYDNGVNTFLIGSCNGLVCYGRGGWSTGSHYYFRVYNPVTGLFTAALDPLGNFQWMLMSGFGYVECKDDYFLFVGGLQRRTNEIFVYVHSLKEKKWRKIGEFGEGVMSIFAGGRGVLVNNTLHWDRIQVWIPDQKTVCGFNLVNETFSDVRIPGVFSSNVGNLEFKLCEINDCLGAWKVNLNMVEMWMLKEYGEWNSWMNLFKIDVFPGLRSFCGWIENGGNVLVQTDDGSLLLVDTRKSPTVYKSIVSGLGDIDTLSFVRSPVSPLF